MRGRVSDHRAELSRHAWPSGRPTCATVWELTAYTNDYVADTSHFSGELHQPILQLGASYGLSSLTELPPPIYTPGCVMLMGNPFHAVRRTPDSPDPQCRHGHDSGRTHPDPHRAAPGAGRGGTLSYRLQARVELVELEVELVESSSSSLSSSSSSSARGTRCGGSRKPVRRKRLYFI